MANIGTTIAPWMLFFQQSSVVDKGMKEKDIPWGRADTLIGSLFTVVVAVFIVIVTGTVLNGVEIDDAAQAASVLMERDRWLGTFMAIGLFDAGLLGAICISLASSWAFGEIFGWAHSLNNKIREAPGSMPTTSSRLITAGLVVLIPGAPLVLITLFVQVVAVTLLPAALVFLILLLNDQATMGEYANTAAQNLISGTIVGVIIVLSTLYGISALFPEPVRLGPPCSIPRLISHALADQLGRIRTINRRYATPRIAMSPDGAPRAAGAAHLPAAAGGAAWPTSSSPSSSTERRPTMTPKPMADGTSFLLSDLIGRKVRAGGRAIGRLGDLVAVEQGRVPEVTHLLVRRPFGHKPLLVPWANVIALTPDGDFAVAIEAPEPYEVEPGEGQICLADHVLDKKVLDCDDDEVEVVYDIKLTARNGLLYATDVDCSRAGFLRRIGLKRVSNFIRGLADSIRSDTIPWTYVQRLPAAIGSFQGNVKLNVLKAKLPEIHPVDLADILEELDHEQRMAVFNALDTEQASDTLEEVEPRVQRQLISSLSIERTAELVDAMTPAQAADLLAALPANDVDLILSCLAPGEVERINQLLEHHEDQISAYTTPRYIAYRPDAAVREFVRAYRNLARKADVVMYVYVTDGDGVLLGVIDIRELLQAELHDRLADIMTTNMVVLNETDSVADARKLFARYGFRAIPVVDAGNLLKGVIPYRDVMQLSHPVAA